MPLPEAFELQFGWRRIIRLTPAHIVIVLKTKEFTYHWDEVTSVELWRLTPDRNDYRELRINLPDQEVHLRRFLHQGQECMTWRGPDSEAIAGFICLHASPSRILDFSLHDAPASLEELNARHQRHMLKSTETLQVMKWSVRCSWGTIAFIPVIMPWPNSLFMVAMYSMLGFAMHWMYRDAVRKHQHQLNEFDGQRKALTEATESAPNVPQDVAG